MSLTLLKKDPLSCPNSEQTKGYFFAVPFVLADPGVNLEKLEDRELNGKTYQVVRVTFDDGTGVAPEDQYVLYVDPETNRMEVLLYSVTYFDSSRASNYSANHYADWQEVGGLLVPQKLVRYHWNPDGMTFGSTRGEKLFDHVEFSQSEASLDVYSQ